jgi:CheY-like chemotaxis protein
VTDRQRTREPAGPPETFVKQVKDALEHLYDLPTLQRHPLARGDGLGTETSDEMAGQHLRRELADAIEALNPGEDVPFRAPHARLYNVLVLHYLERATVQEVAYRLGVSPRQALRNLRQGEKSVAAVLWARRSMPASQQPSAVQLSSFQAEMDRLEARPRPTDLCSLLRRAQTAVEPLAVQRAVVFCTACPEELVLLPTDPIMAEQVLVSAISHAVRQAQPGTLSLTLATKRERVSLTLRYVPESAAADALAVNPAAARLADRLGWTVNQGGPSEGYQTVVLYMAARCPTVLIIDDNEGLVGLLERYLTDQACQVVAAVNGREGLRLAQELLPDAIVLDVMMPGMPGWEVLQQLQGDPQTADIPVVVCSVIIEPELARALGASIFLSKPVRRYDVLAALRRLGVV